MGIVKSARQKDEEARQAQVIAAIPKPVALAVEKPGATRETPETDAPRKAETAPKSRARKKSSPWGESQSSRGEEKEY